jgi:hypothetical protein
VIAAGSTLTVVKATMGPTVWRSLARQVTPVNNHVRAFDAIMTELRASHSHPGPFVPPPEGEVEWVNPAQNPIQTDIEGGSHGT